MTFEMIPRRAPGELVRQAGLRGLNLTAGEAIMLLDAHDGALQSAGRIEFEGGALEALIEAFADSPYLDGAEVLCELTELFYHLKNVTCDRVPDELLLRRMAECFDDCRGSVQLLADRMEGGPSWHT